MTRVTRRSSRLVAGVAALGLLVIGACSSDSQTDPSPQSGSEEATGNASDVEAADSEDVGPSDGYVRVQDVIVDEVSLGGQAEVIIRCFPPDTPPPFEAKALLQLSTYGVSLVSEIVEATEEEDEYRMLITIPPTFEPDDVPPGTYEIWVTCDPNWDVYSAFDLTLTGT